MRKKHNIFLDTLGCRLNFSETFIIAGAFEALGHRVVQSLEEADLCVLNSCTVTAQSDAKCRQKIHLFQKKNPHSWIAVIGCYSQMDAKKIQKMGVDIILGNQEKMRLADYFRTFLKTKSPICDVQKISKKPFVLPETKRVSPQTRASLKIQDGCDFCCAFCIIPFARGRARPRLFSDIIKEARSLAEQGYQELVLTGVNIGTYQEQSFCFMDILEALEKIENLQRIRISSIEPTTVGREIFSLMKDAQSKLVPFLHLPLQAASNKVLKDMRRKYSFEEYQDFIQQAYSEVPDICLGTDMIVGFPTENEAEFEESYQNLQKMPLHYYHVFPFSARKKTRAYHLAEHLPADTIQKRASLVRNLSQKKRKSFYQTQLGKIKKVLFETCKEDNIWFGYTDNYVRVKTSGKNIQKNFIASVKIQAVESMPAEAVLV